MGNRKKKLNRKLVTKASVCFVSSEFWVILVWGGFSRPSDQTTIETNGISLMERTTMVRRTREQV